MSEDSKLKGFPDLSNKLAAPTKKSLFERQKAEAEAKRQREEAETAAVYEDFVKSFEDEDSRPKSSIAGRLGGEGYSETPSSRPPGPSKRHFAPTGSRGNSGPGSLGPAPSSLSRKRPFDGMRREERDRGRDRDRGIFAFDDSPSAGPVDAATAFKTSDDEDDKIRDDEAAERAAAKPTLQLSSLPPGTSPAVIKNLLPQNLTIDSVRIISSSGQGQSAATERKSISAIVTLAKDTPASDIDTAVNGLQNRYLGWGYNLSLSRHLSSAALGSIGVSSATLGSALSSLPFGARPIHTGPGSSLSRAPPPSTIHGRAYAPPSSYTPASQGQYDRGGPSVQVNVTPPSNIKELVLIHKTVEMLITHGPEFEALLMSRPEVQRDEKWAWIWNPRSPGGVWYRWRIWELLTGAKKPRRERRSGTTHRVFEGGAPWLEPEDDLTFEYTTQFSELVSDVDYDSSDEDDSGDDDERRQLRRRRQQEAGGPALDALADDQSYLNPLQKAKLTHLLARLPTTLGRLRKGDVARVTAFAISHAGQGADEVVAMLVANVLRPVAWSSANPGRENAVAATSTAIPSATTPSTAAPTDPTNSTGATDTDPSPAKLIALYLISDILSSSSTSGVRHAWRYRTLFETALSTQQVFAQLGRLERELGWGRLRAEKWRRAVLGLLGLWEGWCVFPAAAQEGFVAAFEAAAVEEREREREREREKEKEKERERERERAREGDGEGEGRRSRWKAVGARGVAGGEERGVEGSGEKEAAGDAMDVDMDVDGEPMAPDEDVDGAPMMDDDDEDVDGAPMADDDEDIDGAPMDDGDADMDGADDAATTAAAGANASREPASGKTASLEELAHETEAARAWKRRPKAEDMFADSDEE